MKNLLTCLALILSFSSFSQALSSDTLHWAEYRTLTWQDFKGEAIDVPGLGGQTSMVLLAGFQKLHLFLPTSAKVSAVFDRKSSWTTAGSMTDQYLKYHQVAFDIYEVYARKLRKEFSQTKFGVDPNRVFQEKYNTALNELSDRNRIFYKETKLGQDAQAVDRWSELIKAELKELAEFRQTK